MENYWGWQQITGWDDVLLLKLYKKYQNIFLTLFYFRVHKQEMLKLKASEKWSRKPKNILNWLLEINWNLQSCKIWKKEWNFSVFNINCLFIVTSIKRQFFFPWKFLFLIEVHEWTLLTEKMSILQSGKQDYIFRYGYLPRIKPDIRKLSWEIVLQ